MAASWQVALEEYVAKFVDEVARLEEAANELDLSIRAYKKTVGLATGSSAKAILEFIELQISKFEKIKEKLEIAKIELRIADGALQAAISGSNRKNIDNSKPRRLSSAWSLILKFMEQAGETGISLEEIKTFIADNKLEIKEAAVRSQLSIYDNEKGFVISLGAGRYRISDAGKELLVAVSEQ